MTKTAAVKVYDKAYEAGLKIIEMIQTADGKMFPMSKVEEAGRHERRLLARLRRKEFMKNAEVALGQVEDRWGDEEELMEGLSNVIGRDLDLEEFLDIMFDLFLDYKCEMDQLRLAFKEAMRKEAQI